jgi:hypothetical protein
VKPSSDAGGTGRPTIATAVCPERPETTVPNSAPLGDRCASLRPASRTSANPTSTTLRSGTLSFWLYIDTAKTGSTATDTLTVKVGSITVATFSNINANNGYTEHTYDVSSFAGQIPTLLFTARKPVRRKHPSSWTTPP